VASVNDIVTARLQGRVTGGTARVLGGGKATLVATAIFRNWRATSSNTRAMATSCCDRPTNGTRARHRRGSRRDRGPGISDLKLAVRSGYSTSGGLGLGLPGVRRIVDDFQIVSKP